MKVLFNSETREIGAETVERALDELGFGTAIVATALNGEFVPTALRATRTLKEGDHLEVLAPMQGG